MTHWGLIALTFLSFAYFLRIWVPFNKKVWSLSFTLVTCGYATLSILLLYLLIDVWNKDIVKKILAPFIWMGSNPLFIYVLMMFVCSLLNCNL